MKFIHKELKKAIKITLIFMMGTSSMMAMDVATYYKVDIQSMEISIDGSKSVLAHLKSGAPLQEQYALDDTLQQNLNNLFISVNSTPSKHAGYYMRHQKEVNAYYNTNTSLQERYKELKSELETINTQIKTLREEQK